MQSVAITDCRRIQISAVSPLCGALADRSAIHAKRVTIQPKDVKLARRLRGERDY